MIYTALTYSIARKQFMSSFLEVNKTMNASQEIMIQRFLTINTPLFFELVRNEIIVSTRFSSN